MEEAPGAVVKQTRYNLRRTAARSRRWSTLSIPREQTSMALEQLQRGVSQHTRNRVPRPPQQQGRDGSPEEEIIREVLPLQRSNEQQNSQERAVRGTSLSSINDHSEVTGADISHIADTVSTARQQFSGRRHIPNSHGIESAPQSHESEANDTHSHRSEASTSAVEGRVPDGLSRNGGETSVTVQRDDVAGHHQHRHMDGRSGTLADSTQLDMQGELISLDEYRNFLIVNNLTRIQRHEINDLPETVIKEEQVQSGRKCSVCLYDFELNEVVNKLPCDHLYHKNCIIPWLEYHNNCPMCRRPVRDNGFHPVSPSHQLITRIRLELVLRDGEVSIVEQL